MKVSIIIPNYNGLENLKRNLPRVLQAVAHERRETEVIVVDDASTDASLDVLKLNPAVRVIKNFANLGFATSCNVGVKAATGDIIILLNSDVYPAEDFINPLVVHFEEDARVFAAGCLEKTLDENGKAVGERGVGKLFFKGGIFQHCAGDLNSKTTDWVCGGSGAFRRDMFLKLGGFDTLFAPFYWEDIDLSYRAKKAGYKLLFEKNSIVYHQHIAGSIARKYSAPEIERISFKNQLLFTRKHLDSPVQLISYALFLLKLFIKKR